MHFRNTYTNESLNFLPFVGACPESKWKEKIESNINGKELDDFQNKILELIFSKNNWTKANYTNFKTSISRIYSRDTKYCCNSILKILSTDDEDIKEELEKFAKLQDFYPFTERYKDKDTGKYVIREKEIIVDDSFMIVTELTKKIRSYVSSLASKFLWAQEDVYVCMDLMIEMLDGRDIKTQEELLKMFDDQFGYLQQISIFSDIYYKYREDFFNIMLYALSFHVSKIRTGTRKNIDVYSYIKQKRTGKE